MSDENLQEMELPSDAELFSQAGTPEPEQTEQTGQARDEAGRFASNEPEKPADEKPAEQFTGTTETEVKTDAKTGDEGGNIPPWRLREMREERDADRRALEAERADRARERQDFIALQHRLAALEKPKQAEAEPDPLLDPQGYKNFVFSTVNQTLLDQRRNDDLEAAHDTHGKLFEEAYAEAQQAMARGNTALAARMNAARRPGKELMAWHQEQKTVREVGNDPNAWLEKKLEERLNDPAFLAKAIEKARGGAPATTQSRPNVNLPPSLSNLTRGGDTVNTSEHSDPMSDAALFAYANKK